MMNPLGIGNILPANGFHPFEEMVDRAAVSR